MPQGFGTAVASLAGAAQRSSLHLYEQLRFRNTRLCELFFGIFFVVNLSASGHDVVNDSASGHVDRQWLPTMIAYLWFCFSIASESFDNGSCMIPSCCGMASYGRRVVFSLLLSFTHGFHVCHTAASWSFERDGPNVVMCRTGRSKRYDIHIVISLCIFL